jgi:hypothetical protein
MPTVTAAQPPVQESGNGKTAGDPSAFGSGFVAGVVAAIRDQETGGAEAHITGALALGWYVAALTHPGEIRQTSAAFRGDLMTITALQDAHVVEYCLSQIQVAFAKLEDLVEKSTLALPTLDALRQCVSDDAQRRLHAGELDPKALAVLSAVDSRLGRAYGIGRALLNLTSRPSPHTRLADHLGLAQVAPLAAGLDDLSSALPAHAGHSVRASLHEWHISVASNSTVVADEANAWLQLARQGELWRSLLTGEKSGPDMLEIEDYIDAADRLSARARTVILRLLKQFWWAALVAAALFAGGIVIVLRDTQSAAAIVAGAGTILAALGLSWRGAGRALGQLTGKLEQPLWGAEIDTAITQAITLLAREQTKNRLGRNTTKRDATAHRRKVAVALGNRVLEGSRAGDGSATTGNG